MTDYYLMDNTLQVATILSGIVAVDHIVARARGFASKRRTTNATAPAALLARAVHRVLSNEYLKKAGHRLWAYLNIVIYGIVILLVSVSLSFYLLAIFVLVPLSFLDSCFPSGTESGESLTHISRSQEHVDMVALIAIGIFWLAVLVRISYKEFTCATMEKVKMVNVYFFITLLLSSLAGALGSALGSIYAGSDTFGEFVTLSTIAPLAFACFGFALKIGEKDLVSNR